MPCPENLLPHSSASADASASSASRRPERDSKSSPMAFALAIGNEITSHLTYIKKNTCCIRRTILTPFNVFPTAATLPKPSAPVLTKVVMRMVLSYIPITIPSTRRNRPCASVARIKLDAAEEARLSELGLRPGAEIRRLHGEAGQSILIGVGDGRIGVNFDTAKRIYVF